ncbi:SCO family protein [Thermaurantiacus sp.]
MPLAVLALAAGGLAACREARAPAGNLEGASIGGPFTLTAETGARVRWDDFRGRFRLVYFGYSFCPDVCPVDTANLAAGLRRFEELAPQRAAAVQPLFITVDPARDTAPVLAEFTAAFHPRLLGLTGSEAEIAEVLKSFRVYARKVPGATEGSYLVDHLAVVYLFDRAGQPVAFLPGPEAQPEKVAALLEAHVR